MWESLIETDRELFLFLNNMGQEGWDAFWMFLSHKLSGLLFYLVAAYLAFKSFGVKGFLLLLVSVALLITACDQLANFFKYGFQRLRPCHDMELSELVRLVKPYCGGKYAFFSAHSANSFGVAFFFFTLFRPRFLWLTLPMILWAAFVAYSRIYIGVHFPGDVVMGMLVGITFGWIFSSLFKMARAKFLL